MGPKTTKAYETIHARLSSGEYPAGERIPSERALVEQLDIGRTALRQVLTRLVYEGHLEVHDRSCYRAAKEMP
jgi:DNA-binding FadR family transcriptional regulator